MPTASLSGEGLKRYQRWLAVQRAKGTEPSQAAMQTYLQGEIQANIASDTDREALSLRREQVAGDLDIRSRRLDLLEEQQDRQAGGDTIRGIGEIAKTVGAVNKLTGGAITSGIKYAGSAAYDWLSGDGASAAFDAGSGVFDAFDDFSEAGSALYDTGSEFTAGLDSTEIFDDVFDWLDI